ncbi:hypothetical protein SprV_0301343500 [Sparganum proliferum]
MLELPHLVDWGVAFMARGLTLQNLSAVWDFAWSLNVEALTQKCIGLMKAHFEYFVPTDLFIRLPAQTLLTVLQSEDLSASSEEQFITAIARRVDAVTSMQQASNVGDTRKLYQLIRQVSGKPSTLSDSVRDVNGGFIADNSAKVERWREHFEHHLNFDTQPTSPMLSSSAEFPPSPTYVVPCDPPSEEEIIDAIRKLRNNKAPGEDGILVPILKKGDKTRCENYRGISLIDVAAKIFVIVLLRRFQAVRNSRTRPNQAGFRAGRGCEDQIFTLRRILEFRHSYQQPTAVCFVDFAAAFDSVHHESLWRIMALDGVPEKIIAMIKAYYRSTTARVPVRDNLSQPFGIRSGVRQGCILSPILFNYAIDSNKNMIISQSHQRSQPFAANNSSIPTFGQRSITLDLGLRRIFRWVFIIADVSVGLIGADFLAHFNLLVDLKNRRLVDCITSLHARCQSDVNPCVNPLTVMPISYCPFHSLLRQFPRLTNPSFRDVDIKHTVTHHISTTGPPKSCRPRRLAPDRLKIAKAEFEHMLELGIIPSSCPKEERRLATVW